jgi:putative ABC transport system permease protein
MFQYNLKMAVRGYLKNRLFTVLNLISLVIGLFVVYIAFDYIRYEFSYDKFHEKSDRLYRLGWTYRSQDYSIVGFEQQDSTKVDKQITQIEGLKNVQGVENVVQFIISEASEYVEYEGRRIQQKDILTTNTPAAFVDVFTWELRGGSFQEFGYGTNKVILTVSTAEKLFGSNALNDPSVFSKNIKIGSDNYALAAIVEDVPINSHFRFNLALNKKKIDYWGSRIYVQLTENLDYKVVENNINASMGLINPTVVKDPLYTKHFLQAISSIHLKSNILYEMKPPGNYMYIALVGSFALFILFIMLFNYANLTLAIQSKKNKIIGVRKALGVPTKSIAAQFLLESTLLTLLALPMVVILIKTIVPFFNRIMGVNLDAWVFDSLQMFLSLLALTFLIGFLAGLVPAIYLSSKNVLVLFKENLRSNHYQFFPIRKFLIINQFTILIGITAMSYFVWRQMGFIENKDIGFQREGILYAYTSAQNMDLFQEKLRQVPGIKIVGNGSSFGINSFNKMTYKLSNKPDVFDDAQQLYLDYEGLKAYQLKTTLDKALIEAEGEKPVITLINRTAAEKLAKIQQVSIDEILGTTIISEPEYIAENGQAGFPFTVAGIFEDINLFSLHEKIGPYFITVSQNLRMDGQTIIAYDPTKTAQVLKQMKSIYNEMNEPFPLEWRFLSENIDVLYKQDSQTAALLFYFNVVAVLLASIGIVGITLFMVVARVKEIGIRKVLGATPFSIIKSTVREYVYFVAIAFCISYPIAYYAIDKWLSNFAYRIDIQHFIFVVVGVAAFLMTALIVALITYKAAIANPIKSLQTD